MAGAGSANIPVLITLGIIGLFGIITFALAAATLGTLNKRYDNLNQQINVLLERIAILDGKIPSVATTATVTPGTSPIASNTPGGTATVSIAASNTPGGTTAVPIATSDTPITTASSSTIV